MRQRANTRLYSFFFLNLSATESAQHQASTTHTLCNVPPDTPACLRPGSPHPDFCPPFPSPLLSQQAKHLVYFAAPFHAPISTTHNPRKKMGALNAQPPSLSHPTALSALSRGLPLHGERCGSASIHVRFALHLSGCLHALKVAGERVG